MWSTRTRFTLRFTAAGTCGYGPPMANRNRLSRYYDIGFSCQHGAGSPSEMASRAGRCRRRSDAGPPGLRLEGVVQVGIPAAKPHSHHGQQVGWEEQGPPSLHLAHVDHLVGEDFWPCLPGEEHQVAQGDGAVATPREEPEGEDR